MPASNYSVIKDCSTLRILGGLLVKTSALWNAGIAGSNPTQDSERTECTTVKINTVIIILRSLV